MGGLTAKACLERVSTKMNRILHAYNSVKLSSAF